MLSTTSGMEHMGIHSLPSSRRKKHVRIKPPKFLQKCETEASRWRDNTTTHQVPFLKYLCSKNLNIQIQEIYSEQIFQCSFIGFIVET